MKIKISIITIIIFTISCVSVKNTKKDVDMDSIKDSLAFELCQMWGSDQTIRSVNGGRDVVKIMQRLDSLNFFKLVKFVKTYGFPNKKLLGERNYKHECVSAAYPILLHNPHMLINNEAYFNLFLDQVNKGNLNRKSFATILDKYYWAKSHGKDVLYGSQFGKPCIQHKKKTNKARLEIGLEILPDSLFSTSCDEKEIIK